MILAPLLLCLVPQGGAPGSRPQAPGAIPVHKLDSGAELMFRALPGAKGMGAFLFLRTGFAQDPKGMEGIAHFLEHLSMTGKTPERKAGWRIQDWMRERPMGSNAMTRARWTLYFSMGKRENILSDLRFFARIARGEVRFDEEDMIRERGRMLQEITNMTWKVPGGLLMWKQRALLDPLGRIGIGRVEDVRRLELKDCEEFRKRNYRPDRALFVLVGDVRREKDQALLNRWLGKKVENPKVEREAPSARRGLPRKSSHPPFQGRHPGVGAPFLSLAFVAPEPTSPEAPAFTLAAFYLLRKAMADFRPRGRETQAFFQAAQYPFLEDPSLFFLNRRGKTGETLEELRAELKAWLERRPRDRLDSNTLRFLTLGMGNLFWTSPIGKGRRSFLMRNPRALYSLGLSTGTLWLHGFPPDFFARIQRLGPEDLRAALVRHFRFEKAEQAALLPEKREN